MMTGNRVGFGASRETAKRYVLLVGTTFAGLLATAFAQSGGGYDMSWSTQAGGADTMSGAAYVLTGTVGQPDAGAVQTDGGAYSLRSGFWPGAHVTNDTVFRSNFEGTP